MVARIDGRAPTARTNRQHPWNPRGGVGQNADRRLGLRSTRRTNAAPARQHGSRLARHGDRAVRGGMCRKRLGRRVRAVHARGNRRAQLDAFSHAPGATRFTSRRPRLTQDGSNNRTFITLPMRVISETSSFGTGPATSIRLYATSSRLLLIMSITLRFLFASTDRIWPSIFGTLRLVTARRTPGVRSRLTVGKLTELRMLPLRRKSIS